MAVLSRRALNRATLDRQLLLRRVEMSTLDAVSHLVGLQAQTPHTWYVGLWTRLVDCRLDDVAGLLLDRSLVRIALMRSTIHLVTAADALAIRPLVQPVIERSLQGNFGRNLVGLDRDALQAAGRELVDAEPLVFSRLGALLSQRWPGRDAASLAQAVRSWVPLVQVPPRGVWRRSGLARHAAVESWLGRSLVTDYPVDDLLLRYLAAFGPASVRDAQTWSGLTRLAEVVERLRPRLSTFHDEDGQELFDLPDTARPDPDTPIPVRFLYDYDNLLLSHADRTRVITEAYRRQNFAVDGPMPRIVLVDGFTAGTWTTVDTREGSTLTVRPFTRLSKKDISAVVREAVGLLNFLAPGAAHDVVLAPPPD